MASISRSELNQLIDKILAATLSTDDFQFSEDVAPAKFKFALPLRVSHRFDDFYFHVDYGSNDYGNDCFVVTHFPGCGPLEEDQYSHEWANVAERFEYWVEKINTELSEPDPWVLLREGSTLADQVPVELGEATFNEEELRRLHQYLMSVREYLFTEVEPSETQTQSIDERLAYLEQTAQRQSKQDWAHIAIGTTWTLAMGLALTGEQAKHLLALNTDFLNRLFRRLLE